MRLDELGQRCGFQVLRDASIASLGFVEIPIEARLVFASKAPFLEQALYATGVAAILTTPHLADGITSTSVGLAVADDPRRSFVDLHNWLVQETNFYGEVRPSTIHDKSYVHPRAVVDSNGVTLSASCRVDAAAIVLSGTTLHEGVRIMPGAVVGSDGFQVMKFGDQVIDIAHAGAIEVGAGTVVMANAVLARAVFRQATRIGAGCRIGNGAFVSHNVDIGDRTLVGHGAIIAGNCRVGNDVTIGPGAICLDRLDIGDGASITAGAVVTQSVAAGERVSGNFAIPHDRFLKALKAACRGEP